MEFLRSEGKHDQDLASEYSSAVALRMPFYASMSIELYSKRNLHTQSGYRLRAFHPVRAQSVSISYLGFSEHVLHLLVLLQMA